ncbi:putative dual-specificity RNA methyltransferase RlmN [Hydrogenophaga sp. T4]|nr:putative dual-specificity RNA methyltransferase RlmN [Hydrogenophaga sp. T4]
MVETVLLPRDGVCVSTQIGCAVGCVFCMTGTTGLIRQVGSAEIVAQVALARSLRPVKKVVFMGMGEPAHNLDNVLEAIDLLGTVGNIGHKNLVFSTVGDPRVFEALPRGRVKPALALSLHTTRPICASGCCRARRVCHPKNWWKRARSTPEPPTTRSSTSGRCSTASTTATKNSTASCACSRASTRC